MFVLLRDPAGTVQYPPLPTHNGTGPARAQDFQFVEIHESRGAESYIKLSFQPCEKTLVKRRYIE